MELLIVCVLCIALIVAIGIAAWSGLALSTLAGIWLIGAVLTFAAQWVARCAGWHMHSSDTLGFALANAAAWIVVVPFVLAINAWVWISGPMESLWRRAEAWWERMGDG